MGLLSIITIVLCGTVVGVATWLGWELLCQNGRLLLRIEELEKRLDDWEFGAAEDEPAPDSTANGDARISRFSNRSLASSKIKRDGLKVGTPAPDFRLPRLDGKGDLTLSELRGRRVLVVFSDPHCSPCNALSPELEKFHRQQVEVGRVTPCAPRRDGRLHNGAHGTDTPYPITVVMISKGELNDNRAKVREHGLTFPIVLQQQWEISRRYAMFATPVAYLIDEHGVIAKDVAVGTDQIQALLSQITNGALLDTENSFVLNSTGKT